MSPCFTTSDRIDRSACDAVFGGEHFSVTFVVENLAHHGRGQCHTRWPLPLFSHIARVFCASTEKEMIRVDASGSIAGMADTHPLRDRPACVFKTSPMRTDVSVFDMGNAISADRLVFRAEPYPTAIGAALNFRPKPFCEHGGNADVNSRHSQAIKGSA